MSGNPERLVALADAMCEEASVALGVPVNVRVLDPAGDLRVVALHAGDPAVISDIRAALDSASVPMPIVEAFVTGEPVVSHRLKTSAVLLQEMMTRQRIVGLLVAPLLVHGRTIGTMTAARFEAGPTDDADLQVLIAASLRLSRAIEDEELFDLAAHELGRRSLIERRQAALLRHGADAVFVISRTGRIIEATPAVTAMLGYAHDEIVGLHVSKIVDPEMINAQFASRPDEVRPRPPIELSARHADGSTRWLDCVGADMLEDPAVAGFIVTARDVTERHQANELLATENSILAEIAARRPLDQVLDAVARFVESSIYVMTPMILTADASSRVKVLAAPSMPAKMRSVIDGLVVTDSAMFRQRSPEMGVLIADSETDNLWRSESRKPGRKTTPTLSWSQQIRDPDGLVLGAICVFLTERREPTPYESHVLELASRLAGMAMAQDRSARAMAHAATHDPLTSLPNRTMFLTRLEQMLERSGGRDSVAVVFVDLDEFKMVNDTSGHAVGDRLLLGVADRLASAVRPMDLIARLGGDEFAILCEGLDADGASMVAERVLDAFEMPFIVDSHLFHVSASAGIAVGGHGSTPDTMLRDADTAMYEAKRMGRARHAVFTPAVRDAAVRRTTMVHELRRAIAASDLGVHYQPVVELGTGRIIGLEALARWTSPSQGEIPPHEFIEVAESAGLIAPLGAVILREAVEGAARWRSDRLLDPDASMAVNVSPYQLADPTFVQTVIDTLARVGFPASSLCLELTESAVMTVEGADEAMARLTGLGITIAIDDFGTGHSSLSRLRTLDAKVLKLDRSFVVDLDRDAGSVEVAAGVIQLAHALGKRLVVEGVETVSQLRLLEDLGADAVQGYYLAHPQPAEAIERLLRQIPSWI